MPRLAPPQRLSLVLPGQLINFVMQLLQLIKICFCHRVNLKNAFQSKPVLSYVLEYEGAEEEDEPHDSTSNVTSRFL